MSVFASLIGGNCRSLPPLSEGDCRSVFRSDKEEMSPCLPLDSVLIIVLRRDWDSKQSAVFLLRFNQNSSYFQQLTLNRAVICCRVYNPPCPPYQGGIVGLCLPYRRGIVGLCLPYRRGIVGPPYRGDCRSVFRSDKEEMSPCLPLDSVLIIVLRRDWDSKRSAVFLLRFNQNSSYFNN